MAGGWLVLGAKESSRFSDGETILPAVCRVETSSPPLVLLLVHVDLGSLRRGNQASGVPCWALDIPYRDLHPAKGFWAFWDISCFCLFFLYFKYVRTGCIFGIAVPQHTPSGAILGSIYILCGCCHNKYLYPSFFTWLCLLLLIVGLGLRMRQSLPSQALMS